MAVDGGIRGDSAHGAGSVSDDMAVKRTFSEARETEIAAAALSSLSMAHEAAADGAKREHLEATWVEEEAPVDRAIHALLGGFSVAPTWVDEALVVDRHVRGILSDAALVNKQAMIMPGSTTSSFYFVRSEGDTPRIVLPLAQLGQGGKKIIYRVVDLATHQLEVFGKLLERAAVVPAGIPFTDEDVARKPPATEASAADTRVFGPKAIEGTHPNVLAMRAVKTLEGDLLGYLSPYIQGQDLGKTLADRNIYGRLLQGTRMVREAAEGLLFLHDQKLCHRDIKPENIMMGDRAMIIDLDGVVKANAPFATMSEFASETTRPYLSPEILIPLLAEESGAATGDSPALLPLVAPAVEAGGAGPASAEVDLRANDIWAMGVSYFAGVLSAVTTSECAEAAAHPDGLAHLLRKIHDFADERYSRSSDTKTAVKELATRIFCRAEERCHCKDLLTRLQAIEASANSSGVLLRLAR